VPRYALKLAYDGSQYHGWQKQPNAVTVQEIIEDRLSTLLSETIAIVGCGRTDTGVHAEDYCAHFDSFLISNLKNLKYKLNKILPSDIKIKGISQVKDEFHARFDATAREYKYYIVHEKNIWKSPYYAIVQGKLDFNKMQQAAQILMGNKDFTSFCKLGSDNDNHFCEVSKSEWSKEGEVLVFTIQANRFLRNMVRAIVGTLIEVGQEKIKAEDLVGILDLKNRPAAKKSADAKGLFLSKVTYPIDL